jgi:hypothetical protein
MGRMASRWWISIGILGKSLIFMKTPLLGQPRTGIPQPGLSPVGVGREQEPGVYRADQIQVKAPTTGQVPDDATVWGDIDSQAGWNLTSRI